MSTETKMNTYEGLFLFPQSAVADFAETVDHLNSLLSRAEAEVIALSKWDERKLAYDIGGNKRGLFFLVYFRAPAQRIADLDRDCNLSEKLLRAMVLRADHLTEEQMIATDAREALADEAKLRAAGEIPGSPTPDSGVEEPVAVGAEEDTNDGDQ